MIRHDLDRNPTDAMLTAAVELAAARLREQGPLPPRPEDVLRVALVRALGELGEPDVATERARITAGWSPLPAGIDIYAGARRPLRWACELKVWDLDQQLWDAIKLACGVMVGDVERIYLLSVGCPTAFVTLSGRELFGAPGNAVNHAVATLLERHACAWQHLLNGGSGRPVDTPRAIGARTLTSPWCWYGHQARLVALDVPDPGDRQLFAAGWPVGVDATTALAADRTRRKSRPPTVKAEGLSVPSRISRRWWPTMSRARRISAAEYEALYGLLLTRGYGDDDIRGGFPPPDGCGPPWWGES